MAYASVSWRNSAARSVTSIESPGRGFASGMRLLLDTHALYWAIYKPHLLTAEAARALADRGNPVSTTLTSAQEIALKLGAGKWPDALDLLLHFDAHVAAADYSLIAPTALDYANALRLPDIPGHRDPFDRFIIAQAMARGMTLVTSDPYAPRYGVPVVVAGRAERSTEARGGRIVPEGRLTPIPPPEP